MSNWNFDTARTRGPGLWRLGTRALQRVQRRNRKAHRFHILADAASDESDDGRSICSEDGQKSCTVESIRKHLHNSVEIRETRHVKSQSHSQSAVIDLSYGTDFGEGSDRMQDPAKGTNPVELGEYSNEQTGQLKKLSTADESRLRAQFRKGETEVIVFMKDSNIYLRGSSFTRLRGDSWLDDEIINSFAGMINERSRRIHHFLLQQYPGVPRSYMFSSFFFSKLCQGRQGFNYKAVQRWTDRSMVDVMAYNLLLFPIHVANNHWALAIIDTMEQKFTYIDPLNDRDPRNMLFNLKRWFDAEVRSKKGETVAFSLRVMDWSQSINKYTVTKDAAKPDVRSIPRQTDGSSCGVFAVKIADCLSMGIPIYFQQRHIQLLRKKIALELLRGSLLP